MKKMYFSSGEWIPVGGIVCTYFLHIGVAHKLHIELHIGAYRKNDVGSIISSRWAAHGWERYLCAAHVRLYVQSPCAESMCGPGGDPVRVQPSLACSRIHELVPELPVPPVPPVVLNVVFNVYGICPVLTYAFTVVRGRGLHPIIVTCLYVNCFFNHERASLFVMFKVLYNSILWRNLTNSLSISSAELGFSTETLYSSRCSFTNLVMVCQYFYIIKTQL